MWQNRPRKRFTTEQIIKRLREAEVSLAHYQTIASVCKKSGITDQAKRLKGAGHSHADSRALLAAGSCSLIPGQRNKDTRGLGLIGLSINSRNAGFGDSEP